VEASLVLAAAGAALAVVVTLVPWVRTRQPVAA
jgi:hypothetical protein